MKGIEIWISKLNLQQKNIFAILFFLGLLLIFYPIANEIAGSIGALPFNFEYTWWIWLIYIGLIGYIEYKIFENKEK